MRLLALLTDGFGAGGGIARYNQDLMTALSQSTHVSEIVVLPRFAAADPSASLAKVCQLAPSPGRVAWSARAVVAAARRRIDGVICGHLNAVPVAAAVAHLHRVPLWVQVHGIEAWQPRSSLYRRCVAAAALITAVSRYTRSRLLAWADVAPHRVRVLPNTMASGDVPRRRRDDLVAQHGLAGRRVILTVGRLSASERYKGHDRVIGALPGILAKLPDAAYLIVGSGEDRPRLEQLAREVGIAGRVVFAGQVADADLADYFALADVFAMPSTGEGFGIVFLEAAACGVPVIGGSHDGSVDALAEGRIGRLVNPYSRAEIEAAVVNALEGRHLPSDGDVYRFSFSQFASNVDELARSLVH
jgi:phosphatidylinositol alpha-1,6-mannosyltransferase